MAEIKFGTYGWRGIISGDFTFTNVRRVSGAVAAYLRAHGLASRGLVIGYDNRFLSERFAETVAGVMDGEGIPVYITGRATPTPVVAHAILQHGTAGAVMITASHNPPEYNGLKFIPEYAGPALPHVTGEIECNIPDEAPQHDSPYCRAGVGERIDPFPRYHEHVAGLVDLGAVGRAGLKVVVDPMYGCGTGCLELVLRRAGAEVEEIRCYRDPLFGGQLPEPTAEQLGELRRWVTGEGARLGLALDGDADRFGVLDGSGEYIPPNRLLPLVYYHLLEVRGLRGPVTRTVATTHMLDRIAEKYGQEVYETPVGFKYIAQNMMERGCLLGGEESGGLTVKGHIPEKDGILAGLLAAEMVAVHGISLSELYDRLSREFGNFCSRRLDLRTLPEQREKVLRALKKFEPERLAGMRVLERNTLDGLKLILEDGSWVLVRPSGTEPLFRVYAEAEDEGQVAALQREVARGVGLV